MPSKLAAAAVSICLALAGCASGYGVSEGSLERARAALAKEHEADFAWAVNNARAVYPERVKEMFASSPNSVQLYSAGVLMLLPRTKDPLQVAILRNNVLSLARIGALPSQTADEITQLIARHAQASNIDGSVKFSLRDEPEALGLLGTPEQRQLVLRNTIEAIQNAEHASERQVDHLMRFAGSDQATHDDRKFIEQQLPALYVEKWELQYVRPVFPEFADLRERQLERVRGDTSTVLVGAHIWNKISPADQKHISEIYRIKQIDPKSYGVISDVHTIDRSSPGSNTGTAVGSALAEAAYIDRAFDRGSYSVWSSIGWALVGGAVGSAANTAPVERYQHYYTILLADGELTKRDSMGSPGDRLAPGTCVLVENLRPVSQATCEQDPDRLKDWLLGE